MIPLLAATPPFLASAGVAVLASETGRARLLVVFKPLTTLLLLGVIAGARSPFARLVEIGIVLSLVGDVALLVHSKAGFLVGLGFFLGAHVAYTAGFLGTAAGLVAGGGGGGYGGAAAGWNRLQCGHS